MLDKIITVKGIGRISVVPDFLILKMEIETKDTDYDKTMQKATSSINELRTAIKSVGHNDKNLKTTFFNINADYNRNFRFDGYKRRLTGYECIHKFILEFDIDMPLLGKTLCVISKCKAKPDLDIIFSVKDPYAITVKLLLLAVDDAKTKAEIIMKSAFTKLGPIQQIQYDWGENVFEIGWGMRRNKKNEAFNLGIISFKHILKSDIALNNKQMRQVETAVNNLPPYIKKTELRVFLTQIKYPLYHLDFETYQQAIPLWDDVSPYMQIPFQYSIHIQKKPRGSTQHKEYLGIEGIDPRRLLTERLCEDIPIGASVIAYNMSFEKMIIKMLAQLFPKYSNHLLNIYNNMIDLMKPFQDGMYYCREMGGSYSIKSVLPALCPGDSEVDYKKLNLVHNGNEAMNAYTLLHEKPPDEINSIRAALLNYCRTDTLAMVKILNKLYEIAI